MNNTLYSKYHVREPLDFHEPGDEVKYSWTLLNQEIQNLLITKLD